MAIERFGGFETGDFADATTTTGSATIFTTQKKTGVYSLRLQPNATRQTVEFTLAGSTTYSMSFWFRIDLSTNPASQVQTALMDLRSAANTSGGIIMIRVSTDGTVELASGRHAGDTAETVQSSWVGISTSTWHLVELITVSHATTGRVAWKLNGTQQDDTGTTVNTGGGTLTKFLFRSYTTSFTADFCFDNWVVRDDSTYPGDNRVILRKVKTGTPTYDAFTKTSGAAASAVWNDVPFDAADEAHSTAADQAQTALVEDVAAGTDPIGANDTINACMVSMIAKKI